MLLVSVNHHYIRDTAPRSGIYPISLEVFLNRLATLRTVFRAVNEQELINALDGGNAEPTTERPGLLITFDDGLAEQMAAASTLKRLGIAAIFFVPTAPLIDNRLLTVHKTHLLRSIVSDETLLDDLGRRFGNRVVQVDQASAAQQYIYDAPTAQRVKYIFNFVLTSVDSDAFVDDAFNRHCGSATAAAQKLYMSRDDIRWLADHDMLGTHAHSHRALAQLDRDEIKREISLSLDILRDITGKDMLGISYPYGGLTAVSDDVYSAARESGLRYGFTMIRGRDATADNATPFALHRHDTQDVARLIAAECDKNENVAR